MFDKVLIANRGEIALRILRACREMGIHTVAVHSTADAQAMHVRLADESVCIGPPSVRESYLNIPAILTAASITGAEAIHPGLGFLAENADFASMVEEHGLTFIGPTPEHIRMMGDKVIAKRVANELGLPTVPGSDGAITDIEVAVARAEEIGYPVLIKASGGGGGRGMKIARNADELRSQVPIARAEAKAYFNNDEVYFERYLDKPRHIEMQILGDGQGGCVHLGERGLLAAALAPEDPGGSALARADAGTARAYRPGRRRRDAGAQVSWRRHAGIPVPGRAFRLHRDEHADPGRASGFGDDQRRRSGAGADPHRGRLSSRLRSEFDQADRSRHRMPHQCREPGHLHAFARQGDRLSRPGRTRRAHRFGALSGYTVPSNYDSLVAKLIVHGKTRHECVMRMKRALHEYVIAGIETNIPLQQRLMEEPDFINGDYDIHWLERFVGRSE